MCLGYLGHAFVFTSKKLDSLIEILGKKIFVLGIQLRVIFQNKSGVKWTSLVEINY